MNMNRLTALSALGLVLSGAAAHADLPGTMVNYTSPKGVTEACIAIQHIPGGDYSKKDLKEEVKLCAVNMYDKGFVLCPKENSTSPGTRIYEVEAPMTREQYFARHCAQGSDDPPHGSVGKFKQTMNQSNPSTSGTYGIAPILYYHMSRYLDTHVDVPVSVYRTMDKTMHYEMVASKSWGDTSTMIGAGWYHLKNAETNPNAPAAADLLTADKKSIFGNVAKARGERYKAEFNGLRVSPGYPGQNQDFQKTAPFQALKRAEPLDSAIKNGEDAARKDGRMNAALGPNRVSKEQMVSWMRDLVDLTILDYIFSQQDRVGNIDYTWDAVWYADGKRKSQKVKSKLGYLQKSKIVVPDDVKEEIGDNKYELIMRTHINDNDAGGLVRYANWTKTTAMLESIRHMNAKTYVKLMELNEDFQRADKKGDLYRYFKESFVGVLSPRDFDQIPTNTALAAAIFQKNCTQIIFDLNPKHIGQPDQVDCATGKIVGQEKGAN